MELGGFTAPSASVLQSFDFSVSNADLQSGFGGAFQKLMLAGVPGKVIIPLFVFMRVSGTVQWTNVQAGNLSIFDESSNALYYQLLFNNMPNQSSIPTAACQLTPYGFLDSGVNKMSPAEPSLNGQGLLMTQLNVPTNSPGLVLQFKIFYLLA